MRRLLQSPWGSHVGARCAAASASTPPTLPCLPAHTPAEVSAPDDFGAFSRKGRLQVPGFPPVALVVMERDGSLGRARAAVEALQAAGVPAGVLVVRAPGRGEGAAGARG